MAGRKSIKQTPRSSTAHGQYEHHQCIITEREMIASIKETIFPMHIDFVRFSSGIYQKSDGERQQYTWQSNKSYLLVNIHHTYKLQVQETRIKCTILWRLVKCSINCVCSAVFAFVGECLAHESVGSIFYHQNCSFVQNVFSIFSIYFSVSKKLLQEIFSHEIFSLSIFGTNNWKFQGTKETLICSYWPFSNASLILKEKKIKIRIKSQGKKST